MSFNHDESVNNNYNNKMEFLIKCLRFNCYLAMVDNSRTEAELLTNCTNIHDNHIELLKSIDVGNIKLLKELYGKYYKLSFYKDTELKLAVKVADRIYKNNNRGFGTFRKPGDLNFMLDNSIKIIVFLMQNDTFYLNKVIDNICQYSDENILDMLLIKLKIKDELKSHANFDYDLAIKNAEYYNNKSIKEYINLVCNVSY